MVSPSKSILQRLFLSFLGFGLGVAIIFPFYAAFFVEWKEGMLPWFVVGCVVAGLSIGLANYYLVRLVLLNRLKRIAEVASAISEKDVSHSCSMESQDMIGDMITSFNAMAQTLRDILGQINHSSTDLDRLSQSASDATSLAYQEADRQQLQILDTSKAVGRLVSQSDEVAADMENASNTMAEASQQGSSANQTIEEARLAVTELANSVEVAREAIARLERKSESIDGVVTTIHSIAEQTNLLALNAAIEAARAGEQGRGFAVVADEVRTLATRTQESTKEIGQLVGELQSGSRAAGEAMKNGVEHASNGVKFITEAVDTTSKMTETIDRVTEINRHAARSATEESDILKKAEQTLAAISESSQQNRERFKQVSDDSEQVSRKATELSQLAGEFKL